MRLIKAGWVMKPSHLASAARTHEGIDFVHPADHLRPSAPEGRAVHSIRRRRGTLGRLAWAGGLGRRGGLLALAAGGVRMEAVVAGQMAPWVRDLHEYPGYEVHRVDPLNFRLLGLVVPVLARVDDLGRAGREAEPGTTSQPST